MSASRVAIIGYRMGNITSLMNAFAALGVDAVLAERPEATRDATHLVLPGVGAFALGMVNLRHLGFEPEIRRHVAEGKPLLGVCLGMQLLGTIGEEHGLTDGLGLIPGRTTALAAGGLRLPHIGWNDGTTVKDSRLFGPGGSTACYYFVHSFVLEPLDDADVVMRCEYGGRFAAAVERGNVFGTQFHPEKSQAAGLAALRRFVQLEC